MALKLRYFSHPDMLRQFQPEILVRIVQTAGGFFAAKGFPIPAPGNAGEIDYQALASILADPDEEMPGDLVDGLHLISELGNEAYFDDLLQMAGEAGIPVDDEVTPQDLAALIWLAQPRLLQQKDQESNFERRKTFESFAPADPALNNSFTSACDAIAGQVFGSRSRYISSLPKLSRESVICRRIRQRGFCLSNGVKRAK
jgi:hypothetical protein